MIRCLACGNEGAASILGLCPSCLKVYPDREALARLHGPSRRRAGLPQAPPRHPTGAACGDARRAEIGKTLASCTLCANRCVLAPGETGYCGVRANEGGRCIAKSPPGAAFLHYYFDRLPTNCCAAWFCGGSAEEGDNLAVFFYGCGFDCFFCQNASHRRIAEAPVVSMDELVGKALLPRVRCVCFFGGSPEPQLPFALEAAETIHRESGGRKRICWEWNGSGNEVLVERAARISRLSGGTVKFDLKAFHPNIGRALCGVDLEPSFRSFRSLARKFPGGELLTATTLLVSGYVGGEEVEGIAEFLAGIDAGIPYSLLVFHPDHLLDDLPVTPRRQVFECLKAARRHLERVEIGNRGLIQSEP